MSLKDDKRRITAIISKSLEAEVQKHAEKERRTKSAMVALLLEEAIDHRTQEQEAAK